MCSLLKRRDIQKMKVYAPLPQADAPCLRGRRAVRTGRPPADRQGKTRLAIRECRRDPQERSSDGQQEPLTLSRRVRGTARMESRAGERPRTCPHRGDRAAAGPSAAKSSISGVMHRRRFFRSSGRRRGWPCSAAGAVIRGGREVRLRCPCWPGGRPGRFAGGSGVHSVGAVRGKVIL